MANGALLPLVLKAQMILRETPERQINIDDMECCLKVLKIRFWAGKDVILTISGENLLFFFSSENIKK